jgi:hypothetical protein
MLGCLDIIDPEYSLPVWSEVLLKKLTITQLIIHFAAFFAAPRPINVLARTRHFSLS